LHMIQINKQASKQAYPIKNDEMEKLKIMK
jgi:hypothetical protein